MYIFCCKRREKWFTFIDERILKNTNFKKRLCCPLSFWEFDHCSFIISSLFTNFFFSVERCLDYHAHILLSFYHKYVIVCYLMFCEILKISSQLKKTFEDKISFWGSLSTLSSFSLIYHHLNIFNYEWGFGLCIFCLYCLLCIYHFVAFLYDSKEYNSLDFALIRRREIIEVQVFFSINKHDSIFMNWALQLLLFERSFLVF